MCGMSELELGVTMEPFKISQQFFSAKIAISLKKNVLSL